MKKLCLFIAAIITSVTLVGTLSLQQTYAQADASSQQACKTLGEINPNQTGCAASNGQISRLIRIVLNMLSIIAGIIAVIMIIVSGFKYVTSQGDANQISSAKKSLIYAIVGIVIVAFAQIIVQFVIGVADKGSLPEAETSEQTNSRTESQQRRATFESSSD